MTKLLICPINLSHLKELFNTDVDGFIIGMEGLSVFLNLELNINEIKKIIELTDKEIFIAINKPLYTKELDNVKTNLIELSKINISGILFDDISIVNINKELNLNLNLVWSQMHLVTNYHTCNYWYDKGVKNAFLSTEITLQDFIDIKQNTKMNLMTYVYGYLPMFQSSRSLVSNYLEYINGNKKNKYFVFEKQRNKHYPIYEKNGETFILEDIINGIREIKVLQENNIDYVVLNGLEHTETHFNIVIDCYIKALNGSNVDELLKILNNNNTGFLYKETIYKVRE